MEEEYLKFVIVGHIDHGKSTLIGRLLYDTDSLPAEKIEEIRTVCEMLGREMEFGYVMDHLEEERDQGITIDTAQIWFSTPTRRYVIIDAPGHVEFLKNMITGASQAEAAVLIVDAAEGVQEQTRRHAYLLSLLGIGQVVVVVNKMDLVGYEQARYDEIKSELGHFLDDIGISPVAWVPISARAGDNVAGRSEAMPWYGGPVFTGALDTLAATKGALDRPVRFVVQDVYQRQKRIAVGRVESGVLRTGDSVVVFPSGEWTTIASIEEFGKRPMEAEAGKSTGIVTADKVFLDRGSVIARPGSFPTMTDLFRARVFWMDRRPVKAGEPLTFRCATQEEHCTIETIHAVVNSSTLELSGQHEEIKNREAADVVIRTAKPVVIDPFTSVPELGRFVLARQETCAGGIITGDEP
jgi:sulfate adenylyltransferase large subunit